VHGQAGVHADDHKMQYAMSWSGDGKVTPHELTSSINHVPDGDLMADGNTIAAIGGTLTGVAAKLDQVIQIIRANWTGDGADAAVARLIVLRESSQTYGDELNNIGKGVYGFGRAISDAWERYDHAKDGAAAFQKSHPGVSLTHDGQWVSNGFMLGGTTQGAPRFADEVDLIARMMLEEMNAALSLVPQETLWSDKASGVGDLGSPSFPPPPTTELPPGTIGGIGGGTKTFDGGGGLGAFNPSTSLAGLGDGGGLGGLGGAGVPDGQRGIAGGGGIGSGSLAGSAALGSGAVGGAPGVGGGAGSPGFVPPMTGGMGGAGGNEDEHERETWLNEDRDVWGRYEGADGTLE
jgi:hypothetical protein